jgi:hypothetical protein
MPIKIVPKEDKKTYDEARSKFLKDYVPESADGSPTPQKYLDYADQEGKEAVEKSKKGKKAGGTVKMKAGGSVKSSAPKMGKVKTAKPSMGGASKRADGIAMRGKTRGKMV